MRKIALTGNIASGKSKVQEILVSCDQTVLDTDLVAHELLDNNNDVVRAFEGFDILENGNISRRKLADIVFSDSNQLEKLNSVMHPQIRQKIEKFFLDNNTKEKVFVAIPLLFEANMQDMFDEIVLVFADDDIRLKRLMARNNYSKEEAFKRILVQMPQKDKLDKVDILINNNGTIEELLAEVKNKLCL